MNAYVKQMISSGLDKSCLLEKLIEKLIEKRNDTDEGCMFSILCVLSMSMYLPFAVPEKA